MNIVLATDKNYLPHLETLLVSIAMNNNNIEKIKVYILGNMLTSDDEIALSHIIKDFPYMELLFINMSEEIILDKLEAKNIYHDRSLSAFSRIFIPDIVEGDRALYLDVDGIVNGNLNELYNSNIDAHAICGVCDTISINDKEKNGIKNDGTYINSGMILWNLELCRKIKIVQLFKDYIKRYNFNVYSMDQGTINGVLSPMKLIGTLHPKYNVMTSLFRLSNCDVKKLFAIDYYSQEELDEAIHSPVFVHFTPGNTTRPWVEHCKHPLKEKYWYYRGYTNYNDKKLQKDNRNLKMRLISWIYYNLPIEFYSLLLNVKKLFVS